MVDPPRKRSGSKNFTGVEKFTLGDLSDMDMKIFYRSNLLGKKWDKGWWQVCQLEHLLEILQYVKDENHIFRVKN